MCAKLCCVCDVVTFVVDVCCLCDACGVTLCVNCVSCVLRAKCTMFLICVARVK